MQADNPIQLNNFLSPFSFFYGMGVRLRNQLFDWGFLPTEQYPIPVICIGNLTAGGTGKTPHTEYIIQILLQCYNVAVLSRGYKRKTSGYLLATSKNTSREIGDEPYQIKRKFPELLVAVDSDRRRGIRNLLALPEEKRPEVILLDDAFQHRYVTPSLTIVLTDYRRLFYYDKLLPVGRLREPITGIRRADVVIVTKCDDDLKPIEFRIIEENMKLLAHQQLFFTQIAYADIVPVFPEEVASPRQLCDIKKDDDILLLAGIASPVHFIKEVERYSNKVISLIFPDHHAFRKQDIRKIKERFDKMDSSKKIILVTEKDAARLQNNPLVPIEWKQVLYYLPITINFSADKGKPFDEMIKKHIVTIQRNSILR